MTASDTVFSLVASLRTAATAGCSCDKSAHALSYQRGDVVLVWVVVVTFPGETVGATKLTLDETDATGGEETSRFDEVNDATVPVAEFVDEGGAGMLPDCAPVLGTLDDGADSVGADIAGGARNRAIPA